MAFITINRHNFHHNLNQIALKTGSIEKIAIVLKDNAYGHGLKLIANLSKEFGVKHAIVKNQEEAEIVKDLFETILILSDKIVKDKLYSFAINSILDIKNAQEGARVELKVDTGMHRNGIAMSELYEALTLIREKNLKLIGVMTHFRSADEMGSELFWQQKEFESVKKIVKENSFENVRFHSHNSAAILRVKDFKEDMVRVGIAAYGYNELPYAFDATFLKPVMTLYASKIATREVKKSQRLGYAGDFTAPKDMIVSTYDLGYGDGWSRADSTKPYITAEGLPILGRVSMDFIILESQKDEVVIMNNAKEAAKQFKTISYEMTTSLKSEISRVLV